MSSASTDIATFVTPYFGDDRRSTRFLDRTVAGLRAQTDRDWRLVIVDDASPDPAAAEHLRALRASAPDRIHLIHRAVNAGQGVCRNVGVQWAAEQGSAIVAFQDADDVSDPRRLAAVRQLFAERPDVDFAYSTFAVIDENDDEVTGDRLTPSVAEIIQSHEQPVEGLDAWLPIGTQTGYTTLTSTIAVRTSLALRHPFPSGRGCEDAHTWLRMSGGGARFAFLPSIVTRYRIPQDTAGSSDRSRLGPDYYRLKAAVELDGFRQAITLASARSAVEAARIPTLIDEFTRRLVVTLRREGRDDIADELLAPATM
jgi:hypothetical protein